MDLTDEQWAVLEPLIPTPPRRADGKGRPWRDPRDILNGILWIFLRTGAPWHDLPERYPPYQRAATAAFRSGSRKAHSRASSTRRWPRISKSAEGSISPIASLDGTFVVWPKRASLGGKDQAGQVGSKLMAMADGSSVPISVNAASASAHEVTLVGETLSLLSVRRGASPSKLVGDQAYDSDSAR
jgi:transposase